DEAVDAGLGRRVVRAALVVGGPRRAFAGTRGEADDAARALLHHVPDCGTRAEERAPEIQADDEVPLRGGHLPDLGGPAAPDVVDEDVQAAVARHGVIDETVRGLLV